MIFAFMRGRDVPRNSRGDVGERAGGTLVFSGDKTRGLPRRNRPAFARPWDSVCLGIGHFTRGKRGVAAWAGAVLVLAFSLLVLNHPLLGEAGRVLVKIALCTLRLAPDFFPGEVACAGLLVAG